MSQFFFEQDRRPPAKEESLTKIILERLLKSPTKAGIFLSILLLGGIFFYFMGGKPPVHQEDLPLIKAPPGPSRVQPETAGNPLVPHQDRQVYKNIEKAKDTSVSSKVEHLLPPVEAPALSVVDEEEPIEIAPEVSVQKEEVALPKADSPPKVDSPPKAIEKVKAPSTVQSIDQLLGIAVSTPSEPMIRKGGKYRLQLGSLPTREAAEQEWTRIQRVMKEKEPAFARLKPLFERIDLGAEKGGIIYRIILASISSKESAKTLENRLKEKKISCLVIAP